MHKSLSLKLLVFILLFLHGSLPAVAQKDKKNQALDSVRVKGRSFLILGDSSIYVEKDTVFVLPDSIAVKLKRDETRRSDDFYKKIKERLYRTKFTRELYDLLFRETGRKEKKQEKVTNGSYKKYEGQPINNIVIKKLEAFGPTIEDTTRTSESWAVNVANDIHILTRRRVIKDNIFFKEGDIVNADVLSDSERVLRNLPYIKDARIYVIQKPGSEAVDVLIIVKDIWSISAEMSFGSLERSKFAVIEKNFLGLGHEVRNELLYNTNYEPIIGYSGTYTINNIRNTFITGEFNYAHSEPLDRIGVRFFKNFITPEIKFAGGLEVSKNKVLLGRVYRDTTILFNTEFERQDLWFGRSWLIDERENNGRTNLQMAGRFNRERFLHRPPVNADTNHQFFDTNLYLLSLGISHRSYEKGSLILGYGRTEDIPKGYLLEFTAGREINEFYDRPYFGWRFSLGNYIEKVGYLRPSVAMGGFIRNEHVEQGIFKLRADYFSNLYRIKKINFRQFFRFDYTLGINRFDNEFIDINNDRGVRGLRNTFLRGTKRASFSAETVAFLPFYLVGFRLAVYGFADLAVINLDGPKLLKNKVYQGYGAGVRLRNENLAFNTIQIRLAWYPNTPPDVNPIDAEFSGEAALRIDDFRIEHPEPISFN